MDEIVDAPDKKEPVSYLEGIVARIFEYRSRERIGTLSKETSHTSLSTVFGLRVEDGTEIQLEYVGAHITMSVVGQLAKYTRIKETDGIKTVKENYTMSFPETEIPHYSSEINYPH